MVKSLRPLSHSPFRMCICSSNILILFLGGAPNYYPNSFTGPEDQPNLKEAFARVSGDVQRYNSADEDNVSQVSTVEMLSYVTLEMHA